MAESATKLLSISEYITFLKKVGISTNNLYIVRFNLANQRTNTIFQGKNTQTDNSQSNEFGISSILSGVVDVKAYVNKAKGIYSNVTGIFNDIFDNGGTEQESISFQDIESVEILCTSAQIPYYKQKMQKTYVNHHDTKFATGFDTDAVKMTFYVDRSNHVLNFFNMWNNRIYNVDGRHGVMNYKQNYSCAIEIFLVNKNQKEGGFDETFRCKLVGAYPAYIEPLNLNNNNTELLELNVQFEYDKIDNSTLNYQGEENKLGKGLFSTGINIIDMKNRVEQTINNVRDMGKMAQNTVKSARHTVDDMRNTAKRIFRF
ncbi:MAG: hypothetical protein RBT49_04595 [Bacteroidales bacterium]|jgi:hypothetical protein|nr:hypothetical protein [Bacteroidales bacterium]